MTDDELYALAVRKYGEQGLYAPHRDAFIAGAKAMLELLAAYGVPASHTGECQSSFPGFCDWPECACPRGVQGRPAFPLMDPQRRRELNAASGVQEVPHG